MALRPFIQASSVTTPAGGVDDGGNAAIASAFGDLARSARALSKLAAQRERERGIEDAQAAFDEASAKTPAGEIVAVPDRDGGLLDMLGVRGASYDNAIKLLSIQRAEEDFKAEVGRLRADYVGDPDGFADAADSFISGYIDDAPADTAQEIERVLKRRARVAHGDVATQRAQLDQREARQAVNAQMESLETEISDALDRGGIDALDSPDVQERIAEITDLLQIKTDDPGFVYSEAERERDMASFIGRLQLRATAATLQDEVKDALDFQGIEGAKEKLAAFMAEDEFQSLRVPDQKKLEAAGKKIIQQRETEIKAAIREAKANRAQFQSANYGDLLIRVVDEDETLTRADLDEARQDGKISDGQFVSLLQQFKNRSAKQARFEEALDRVNIGALNPASADDRKAVDLVYEGLGGDTLLKEDPETGLDLALQFAQTNNIVPALAVDRLKAYNSGGSAEQQGYALDSIARILEEAPGAARQAFKDQEIKEAVFYREFTAAGAPEELAIGAILKQREAKYDPVLKERRKETEKVARAELDVSETLDVVGAELDAEPGFLRKVGATVLDPTGGGRYVLKRIGLSGPATLSGGEAAARRANVLHQQLYAEYLAETQDPSIARKQADAVLKRTYGATQVMGAPRVMMHPPESYYGVPGVKNEWMRTQFAEEVAALGDGEYELVSDIQTAAEAQKGYAPSYLVTKTDDKGVISVLDERFVFDPTDALKERSDDLGEDLERARRIREGRGKPGEPKDMTTLRSVR